jgi:hypothetical protein
VKGRILEAVRRAPGPIRFLVFAAETVAHVDGRTPVYPTVRAAVEAVAPA